MTDTNVTSGTQQIVVEDVLPFAPSVVWRGLTTSDFIARWMMEPMGFEPVVGNRFTFRTTAAGQWDGIIHCEVLEVEPERRFVYSWKGGHEANEGYGSRLDSLVTWTLSPEGEGTRLRLVHSGFVRPRNDIAYRNMSDGWVKCVDRLTDLAERPY